LLRYTVILSSHLSLGLPSSLFPSGFATKYCTHFHLSHVCYMFSPSYLSWFDRPTSDKLFFVLFRYIFQTKNVFWKRLCILVTRAFYMVYDFSPRLSRSWQNEVQVELHIKSVLYLADMDQNNNS
jgi:hypothetical protein